MASTTTAGSAPLSRDDMLRLRHFLEEHDSSPAVARLEVVVPGGGTPALLTLASTPISGFKVTIDGRETAPQAFRQDAFIDPHTGQPIPHEHLADPVGVAGNQVRRA